MKYEFYFLFTLVVVGLMTRKLSWRGWLLVALFVVSWIALCWKKG